MRSKQNWIEDISTWDEQAQRDSKNACWVQAFDKQQHLKAYINLYLKGNQKPKKKKQKKCKNKTKRNKIVLVVIGCCLLESHFYCSELVSFCFGQIIIKI